MARTDILTEAGGCTAASAKASTKSIRVSSWSKYNSPVGHSFEFDNKNRSNLRPRVNSNDILSWFCAAPPYQAAPQNEFLPPARRNRYDPTPSAHFAQTQPANWNGGPSEPNKPNECNLDALMIGLLWFQNCFGGDRLSKRVCKNAAGLTAGGNFKPHQQRPEVIRQLVKLEVAALGDRDCDGKVQALQPGRYVAQVHSYGDQCS